jgi:hypothetical protein
LQSKIATRVGISWGETVRTANGSSNNNHRNIDEERHDEGETALDEEVTAGHLSKTR